MRVIVSDTSCVIDLMKVNLLEKMLALPYTFTMPATLFNDEWLYTDEDTKQNLRDLGLEINDLPGPSVSRATRYLKQNPSLTLNDCFSLVLAEDLDDSMLLTGDASLKQLAERNNVETHGVLWITDKMERHGVVPVDRLHKAFIKHYAFFWMMISCFFRKRNYCVVSGGLQDCSNSPRVP